MIILAIDFTDSAANPRCIRLYVDIHIAYVLLRAVYTIRTDPRVRAHCERPFTLAACIVDVVNVQQRSGVCPIFF